MTTKTTDDSVHRRIHASDHSISEVAVWKIVVKRGNCDSRVEVWLQSRQNAGSNKTIVIRLTISAILACLGAKFRDNVQQAIFRQRPVVIYMRALMSVLG
jgi:hypothetical protein